MENLKIIAVTQARVGSTRFPEKILKEINKKSLLELHIKRILKSTSITKLIVATTNEPGVENIISIAQNNGTTVSQGSLDDVLDRFYQAVKNENPDYVVRLTSDCPLIDPKMIDDVVNYAITKNLDFCSNGMIPVFPDGQDVAVFKFSALEEAWRNAKLKSEREHVTPYIVKNSTFKNGNKFKSEPYTSNVDYNKIRLTVDEPNDLEVIKKLIFEKGDNATWEEYTKSYIELGLDKINGAIIRNEGYLKSIENE